MLVVGAGRYHGQANGLAIRCRGAGLESLDWSPREAGTAVADEALVRRLAGFRTDTGWRLPAILARPGR